MFSNRTLLVRHYRVYYPVRIHLIQHMVSAMQRLGFTTSVSEENLDNMIPLLNYFPQFWEKKINLTLALTECTFPVLENSFFFFFFFLCTLWLVRRFPRWRCHFEVVSNVLSRWAPFANIGITSHGLLYSYFLAFNYDNQSKILILKH